MPLLIRGCSSRLRLILDVLEIICFNLIHFAIELSGIHIKAGDDGKSVQTYRKGELIWFVTVNVFGFLAPIVLLVKIFGFRIPKCLLRGYYSMASLFLVIISFVVTLTTYFQQEAPSCQKDVSLTDPACVKKEDNSVGFELVVLSLTLMNSIFYGYSLVLTWLKEDAVTNDNEETADDESDESVYRNSHLAEVTNETENKQAVKIQY